MSLILASVAPREVRPACGCKKGHKRFGRCRISRPLCRKMRRAKGLCGCTGYHYPHRKGGGFCEHGSLCNYYRNRVLYGPEPVLQVAE